MVKGGLEDERSSGEEHTDEGGRIRGVHEGSSVIDALRGRYGM